MKEIEGEDRLSIERVYDIDNNNFMYSNIDDYIYDDEINSNNKYIITNKMNFYIENRDKYNIRYIPYYVTRIKQKTTESLENVVNKTNIVKIEECNISTKLLEWKYLLKNRNVEKLKEIVGDIYLIPTNAYRPVSVGYKHTNIHESINILTNDRLLSCKNSLTLSIPINSKFTILNSPSYYLNYDSNHWYWFSDEDNDDTIRVCLKLLNYEVDELEDELCHTEIIVNEKTVDNILKLHSVSFDLLNRYEIDFLNKYKTADDCIEYIKKRMDQI